MKKAVLLFSIVLFLFSAGQTLAEPMVYSPNPDPDQLVPVCYTISNMAKYNNYVYLLIDDITYDYLIISDKDCISTKNFRKPRLYAIKADYFDEEKLQGEKQGIIDYLKNIKVLKFIYREQLPYLALIEKDDVGKIDRFERFLKIDYLTNTDTLNIVNEKSRTIYSDGSHLDEDVGKDAKSLDKDYYWYFGLIGLALTLIVLAIMTIKKK